ncbi:MAG TPA: hypothetical protein VGC47_08515 [Acidimicrobiia bacterium]|jgi:hypothetical protein
MNEVSNHDHTTEDRLLAELAGALHDVDPVPDAVIEAAKVSYTWRTVDAELAELVYDSAAADLAGVRGGEGTRQVTFRAPGIEIEVAVVAEGARRIIGQLVPPQRASVELRFQSDSVTTESDDLGRFTFDEVPIGPISLRCTLGDGESVVQTDWMLL